mgnify:CR=1 FL=1|tara:strand:+ start:8217 stop:8588 length:372 start_codon:yes stop_codon:yes gene_type:complete
MALITLNFSQPINASCQVGDEAYHVTTSTSGGFTINSNNIESLGSIREISADRLSMVTFSTTAPGNLNGTNKYIFFAKDNQANLSSMLGYFSKVKFVNDDTKEAELYEVGLNMFESSGNAQGQ